MRQIGRKRLGTRRQRGSGLRKALWCLPWVSALTIAILGAAFSSPNAPIGPSPLLVSPAIQDIGTFEPNETAIAYFDIWNTGDRPVSVLDVKSTCRCQIPDSRNFVLPPGEHRKITVKVSTNNFGPQSAALRIITTEDAVPRFAVLRWSVRGTYFIDPPLLRVSGANTSQPTTHVLNVHCFSSPRDRSGTKLLDITYDSEMLSVRPLPVLKTQHRGVERTTHRFSVQFVQPQKELLASPSNPETFITLVFEKPERVEVQVPVIIKLPRMVRILPPYLVVQASDQRRKRHIEFNVTALNEHLPARVIGVEGSPGIQILKSEVSAASGATQIVSVEVRASAGSTLQEREYLRFRLAGGRAPTGIEVPLFCPPAMEGKEK